MEEGGGARLIRHAIQRISSPADVFHIYGERRAFWQLLLFLFCLGADKDPFVRHNRAN